MPVQAGSGWEGALSGLRQMHVDVKRSIELAGDGEDHARGFLDEISHVKSKVAVSRTDVTEAIAALQLLLQAAKLHMEGGS